MSQASTARFHHGGPENRRENTSPRLYVYLTEHEPLRGGEASRTGGAPIVRRGETGTDIASLLPDDKRNRTVKVLLADDDTARAAALMKVLSADPGLIVLRPAPGELLADAVAALAPDVVLVDMARPDRDALEGIRVIISNVPRPIVLFVDHDDPAFMEEAIGAGVSSYNVLGVPPPDVKPILRAAAALFRHHQTARTELRDARTKLSERALIDRAKAILIKERRMDEPDAYRWLRERAMATKRRIPDVAHEIIRTQAGGKSGPDVKPEREDAP